MKEQKNHIHYSAEDIRKYLDGELSHPEMQAIEKAALDDPFLADVMDGLEESRKQPGSFEVAVSDLNNRLSARIREKNQKPGLLFRFSRWKVAATIFLLLGVTLFTYKYTTRTRRGEIAKTSEKDSLKNIPVPVVTAPDSFARTSSTATPGNVPEANAGRKNIKPADERKSLSKNKVVVLFPDHSKTAAEKEDETAMTSAADSGAAFRKDVSRSFAPRQGEGDEKEIAQSKPVSAALNEKFSGLSVTDGEGASKNYIKGVVVDQKGKPIPFAPIKFKGEKGIYSDSSGFFKLYMKDPRLAALIYVHPGGYEPISVELEPDSSVTNTIRMESDPAALNEVVALGISTGSKKRKKAAFSETDSLQMTRQLNGWDAFLDYIQSGKKITTGDSVLKGEEVISFQIDNQGKLSAFRVESSISPAHDDELKRLIQTAPGLKLRSGKKLRVQVRIWF
jgi:hypothetical protein